MAGYLKGSATVDLTAYMLLDGTRALTGNVLPDADNTRALGSSSFRYSAAWSVDARANKLKHSSGTVTAIDCDTGGSVQFHVNAVEQARLNIGGLSFATAAASGVVTTATDTALTLTGRRNAGSSTADVISASTNNRSAGFLHGFQRQSTQLAGVDWTGKFSWVAGNEQTTVGAAGGASALPATPTKYLLIRDSAGTTLAVPAYAAS